MSILMDLILIGILLLCIFIGYKKGLIGVAFKILSFIIALIITLVLYKPISGVIIQNTNFDESIENAIVRQLGSEAITDEGIIKQEETKLPKVITNYMNEMVKDTVNKTKDTVVHSIAKELSITAIQFITIIGLFIITKILLLFAKAILEGIASLPLIKQFNEIGGIAYGVFKGLMIIYLLLAIASLVLPMIGNTAIVAAINNSILTKIFYQNNIILMFLF